MGTASQLIYGVWGVQFSKWQPQNLLGASTKGYGKNVPTIHIQILIILNFKFLAQLIRLFIGVGGCDIQNRKQQRHA